MAAIVLTGLCLDGELDLVETALDELHGETHRSKAVSAELLN
jgi:hypothetical protein